VRGALPAARQLAAAAATYTGLAGRVPAPGAPAPADTGFEPAVALSLGNLPGSPSVAKDVHARGRGWNPLRGVPLSTRQAFQAACAGGLAIVVGKAISEQRYYWAVIAAFVAFTGTATRSETVIKAGHRVLGTLLGIIAGIGLAHLTTGHSLLALTLIVVSMSVGFYLVKVSYAYMIFFVTIMVAQMYTLLHEFSAELLLLRLEETAAGALVGILVSLLFLPTSTRDTVNSARAELFGALTELLEGVALRFEGAAVEDADPDALAREVDHRLRALALVARPLTRPLVWRNNPSYLRERLRVYAAAARRARVLVPLASAAT
ncbi:FUSC family protein, partial [Streptomyces sp. SA3_actF]